MNPYSSPQAEETPPAPREPGKWAAYFSPNGSFSRPEFACATFGILGLVFLTNQATAHGLLSNEARACVTYALYPVWGLALGKRSRDLGTTFTYGMLVGMLFPIIGIVFLFQEGKKEREAKAASRRNQPHENQQSPLN